MFGKKKPEPAEEAIFVAPAEPVIEEAPVIEEKKPEVKPAGTFIAEGVTLIGNFETSDDFEIKGTVRGTVVSSKPMYIDVKGALYGDAKVESLYVDGEVEGSIIVDNISVFSGTGSMRGNLSTAMLRTDAGCVLEGTLKLDPPKKAEPAPVYEAPEEAPAAQDFDAIFDGPAESAKEKDLTEIKLD